MSLHHACRLVMGTRCGDLDPAVVLYLMDKCGLSGHDTDVLLNKRSGFLGLAGKADVRAVLEDVAAGSERAQLALDVRTACSKNQCGGSTPRMHGLLTARVASRACMPNRAV